MNTTSKTEGKTELKAISSDDCITFLVDNLSTLLDTPKTTIDINFEFSDLALDSASLIQLTAETGQFLGIELEPTLLLESGSIKALADLLVKLHQAELNKIKAENKRLIKVNVLASFTAEPLEESLNNLFNKIGIKPKIEFAPYNQVFQKLIDQTSAIHAKSNAVNIILFRIEDFFRFNQEAVSASKVRQTVSDFIALLTDFVKNTKVPVIIVMCPHTPANVQKLNVGDILNELDNTISECLKPFPNAHFLDTRDIASSYKLPRVLDEEQDEMEHIPFSQEFFNLMGYSIVRFAFSLLTTPYKVIVIDCDNTLWGGVCGEVGALDVDVSGPFIALQKTLLAQKEQGTILCLCSKNDESDVWAVFEKNKNMLLRRDDIAAYKINWERKSQNIVALAKELSLGLDSFIFVDENPIECDDVTENIPQVLTIQLPTELDEIPYFLCKHWAFDSRKVTDKEYPFGEIHLLPKGYL